MNFQQIKEKYIKGLLETNAFIVRSIDEEPFTLRSGKKSYMFLDHSRVANSAIAYRAFIDIISELIRDTFGEEKLVLCNVDSKISAQMVGSVAYNLKLPQIIYKSEALTQVEQGTNKQFTGNDDWSYPVAILDDVASGTDGTAKAIADQVKAAFPKVQNIHIFVGFVREITRTTYPLHHVLTRNELLGIVGNTLSKGQQEAVTKELNLKS